MAAGDDRRQDSRARPRRSTTVAGAAIALIAVLVATVVVRATRGPDARSALEDFLSAYEQRDFAAAAELTDGEPKRVAAQLRANVDGLDGAALDGAVVGVSEDGGTAVATTRMSWDVPGIGPFEYEDDGIRIARSGEDWLVRWTPEVIHPALDSPGSRLGTDRSFPDRAPIVDRHGSKLVIPRPVVEIGVVPGRLRDRDAAVEAIAAETGADARALRRSLRAAASPESFVPAITLRLDDYEAVRERLDAVPGVMFGERELPLAPTREFARALLGTVGPITAEQLDQLGAPYAVGDNVGQAGLEARFERRLAGTPDRRVITRLADGTPAETLLEVDGEHGRALHTTLDGRVQVAAEDALGSSNDVEALVAVQPSTGDVLAAATRPVDDAFNRGFEGRYPPGSTFKVITTAALLARGLDPDRTVDCPPTIEVGGRSFRNFEHGAAGAVPFRRDFAESCNTAFISLAGMLEPADLRRTAKSFGLGRGYRLALPAFSGDVPVPADEVEQAASMIGQGRILVSPLAMAGVAATVADGRWHAPRLLAGDPREQGAALPPRRLAVLRSLMRVVVTGGTGTALAHVAGEPLGKSGTAEYGSGDPPPTHAWFIAARGDLAVAMLVEDKPSGGEYAAPIVARFLEALE